MKKALRCAALLLCLSAGTVAQAAADPAIPPVDEIVARVQQNVEKDLASLPNFLCDERITSQVLLKGKVGSEIKAESIVRAVRAGNEGTERDFVETREVVSVNGAPARGQELRLPINVKEAASGSMAAVFGAANIRCFDVKIGGIQEFRGHKAVLLRFATKKNAANLGGVCPSKTPGQGGQAWIDPEAMEVLRIESTKLRQKLHGAEKNGLPIEEDALYSWSIDFAKVLINGQPFWMPLTDKAEAASTYRKLRLTYVAEYSNYHKFGATSKIVPDSSSPAEQDGVGPQK
jgi:hypothetical protein